MTPIVRWPRSCRGLPACDRVEASRGAAMAKRIWMYVGGRAGNKPPPAEKAAITAACEKLIAEVLRPRFLPEIHPAATFNYPVAIEGR